MTEQVIKFENKEYIWQDIEGKGRCLIPYEEKRKDLKEGMVFEFNNQVGVNVERVLIKLTDSKLENERGWTFIDPKLNNNTCCCQIFLTREEVWKYVERLGYVLKRIND